MLSLQPSTLESMRQYKYSIFEKSAGFENVLRVNPALAYALTVSVPIALYVNQPREWPDQATRLAFGIEIADIFKEVMKEGQVTFKLAKRVLNGEIVDTISAIAGSEERPVARIDLVLTTMGELRSILTLKDRTEHTLDAVNCGEQFDKVVSIFAQLMIPQPAYD